jgi:site-specific DNA-methyltransferase (adenine-specific)
MNNILQGDCINRLKELDDNSVDAIVTDPPYELGFMGKKWDASGISYNVELWKECLRVLKAGGHLLSFGGTRTYHRMACGIEDAGFEIRDMLEWIYASGFPKSHNIGKAYDKKMGNERKDLGTKKSRQPTGVAYAQDKWTKEHGVSHDMKVTKGSSPYEGWGTALKPAHEPIVMARKPLSEKTIVENCIKHGTGALDIDGCRIPFKEDNTQGRFPANLLVTDDVLGEEKSRYFDIDVWGEKHGLIQTPKVSKKERNAGCEGMEEKERDKLHIGQLEKQQGDVWIDRKDGKGKVKVNRKYLPQKNNHPTVKPIKLMQYLVRLVSKKGDTVLDPFMGSGTTGVACKQLDRNFIGIELNEEYIVIAEKRIAHQLIQKELFVA